VGKVVIAPEARQPDSITTILEEMKTEEANNAGLAAAGVEYATAIPVAVTNLKEPQKGLKRMGPPSTIVLPTANKKGQQPGVAQQANVVPQQLQNRNIIIASGGAIPQGAIPVQISGLNVNALPMSAVKSIPLPINLSTLTPTAAPAAVMTSAAPQMSAKKSKAENRSASAASIIQRVTNNNSLKSGAGVNKQGGGLRPSIGAAGNNKTCNWQFENGEICGKTFSKSYNLVVHMRMHEDVRPFKCNMCEQTFRQKAHLQRHETTHGIGVKVSRAAASGGGGSAKRSKKRRSSRGSASSATLAMPTISQLITSQPQTQTVTITPQLQERLARVSQQFGTAVKTDAEIVAAAAAVEEDQAHQAAAAAQHQEIIDDEEDLLVNDSFKRRHSDPSAGGAAVAEPAELKDGEAFLAAATGDSNGAKAVAAGREVAVKLKRVDESGNVLMEVDQVKDEDIIENLSGGEGPEGPRAAVVAANDSLAAAVSEAVEGTELAQEADAAGAAAVVTTTADGQTIVLSNLDEHKNLLSALLTGGPSDPEAAGATVATQNESELASAEGELGQHEASPPVAAPASEDVEMVEAQPVSADDAAAQS